mgnify:CR=1 FL=1
MRFNPTLVRLAPQRRAECFAGILRFNPTLVRLALVKRAEYKTEDLVSIPPWFD